MRLKTPIAGLILATTLMAIVGCTTAPQPTSTPTATHVPLPLPTTTVAPTPPPVPTALPTQTLAPTETPVPTATPVPTPTEAPTPTPVPAATPAPTPTPPPSPTATAVPTSTPEPTPTSLPTSTPLPTLSPEDAAATEALVPGWIELQYGLVELLLELKLNHPEASALFESMAWVQDHIGNSDYDLLLAEVGTATRLRELWRVGPLGQEMFLALLCKPWMQDDLSINESGLIDGLAQVFEREPDGAMGLLDMPFLDTTEEAVESRIVDLLSNLLYYFTDLRELLFRPEFSDGITDDHVTTLVLMYYETQEPEAVALMEALPWIQDGADASELEEVERLMRLAWAAGSIGVPSG